MVLLDNEESLPKPLICPINNLSEMIRGALVAYFVDRGAFPRIILLSPIPENPFSSLPRIGLIGLGRIFSLGFLIMRLGSFFADSIRNRKIVSKICAIPQSSIVIS